jgi:hypothetical protein
LTKKLNNDTVALTKTKTSVPFGAGVFFLIVFFILTKTSDQCKQYVCTDQAFFFAREVNMACFLAPLTEAVVISAVKAVSRRIVIGKLHIQHDEGISSRDGKVLKDNLLCDEFGKKLNLLTTMLYGGSLLLAIEHVWHGEVVPWFPFLTAMKNPDDTKAMLHEIATTGVSMAILVTVVWTGMVMVLHMIEKRDKKILSVGIQEA